MTSNHSDISPAEASHALAWLVEMGADEVMLEAPVNRLITPSEGQSAVTPAARPKLATPEKPKSAGVGAPSVWQPSAAPDDLISQAVKYAEACTTPDALQQAITGFTDHPLQKTASNLCFINGAAQSRVLVLADRPRTEEDRAGTVLAGKHQVLAERMLDAIGLSGFEQRPNREQVMLANFIPWRPPGNRAPTELEAGLCLPFIRKLIDIMKPKAILCFGALPGQLLAGGEDSIPKARGKWLSVVATDHAAPLITTFHPETLLKSPGSKRLAWHDLQAFRDALEAP